MLYAVWEKNSFPTWGIALIAAAAVIVIAVVIVLALRGKKRKAVAPVPAAVTAPAPPRAKNAGSDDSGWRIECVSGALQGKRFMVKLTGTVLFGRDPQSGIVFPNGTPGVSGRHCELWFANGNVYLRDLDSSHGTFLAGSRIPAQQPAKLNENDIFWLGSEKEQFRLVRKAR